MGKVLVVVEAACPEVQRYDGTCGCLGTAWTSAWLGHRGQGPEHERSRVELGVTIWT